MKRYFALLLTIFFPTLLQASGPAYAPVEQTEQQGIEVAPPPYQAPPPHQIMALVNEDAMQQEDKSNKATNQIKVAMAKIYTDNSIAKIIRGRYPNLTDVEVLKHTREQKITVMKENAIKILTQHYPAANNESIQASALNHQTSYLSQQRMRYGSDCCCCCYCRPCCYNSYCEGSHEWAYSEPYCSNLCSWLTGGKN